MTPAEFTKIAYTIPAQPGIYKYFDSQSHLIYVGKAKNLKKRVRSYFNKQLDNQKTIELVKRIHHIEFVIVNSEEDAFLLESTLIKENQPFYNINLKDDKGYPYLVIKKEPFPRVFFSRKKINDGAQYFGPYTSTENVSEMLHFVQQQFPFRTCKLPLSEKNIQQKKFKVCLEYHLGNCKGPCEQKQSAEEYQQGILQLTSLLKGNLNPVIQQLKKEVDKHSSVLAFEKAAFFQQKINNLLQFQSKSAVVNINSGNLDVFSMVENEDQAYINYLGVNNGCIIYTKTITIEKKLDESQEEILLFGILQIRELFNSDAKEIIVPFEVNYPQKDIKIIVPKVGEKKKLIDLSLKNVLHYKYTLKSKQLLQLSDEIAIDSEKVLQQIKTDLRLAQLPIHIECFDNSNLHGTNAVAAMVCFKNGIPSKQDYRKFNIKTVEGIDDFASMKEIVFRRYKKLIETNLPLPQLVIIDGGKGQLGAALESIQELGLIGKLSIVGLAKNKEELFFPGDQQSLQLPWDSKSLLLIRRIRDEVHRFGITFHRDKRSQSATKNELEAIHGIGKSTATTLLQQFKSVKKIKSLPLVKLEEAIGVSKAAIVFNALHSM